MKVLIVDDEPLAREELHYLIQEIVKLQKYLKQMGFLWQRNK